MGGRRNELQERSIRRQLARPRLDGQGGQRWGVEARKAELPASSDSRGGEAEAGMKLCEVTRPVRWGRCWVRRLAAFEYLALEGSAEILTATARPLQKEL